MKRIITFRIFVLIIRNMIQYSFRKVQSLIVILRNNIVLQQIGFRRKQYAVGPTASVVSLIPYRRDIPGILISGIKLRRYGTDAFICDDFRRIIRGNDAVFIDLLIGNISFFDQNIINCSVSDTLITYVRQAVFDG